MNEERAGETAPLVTIRCITYNHEPYIRQCLEGFVMQKTTFPFEAIVHDDASTDGTAAIIREYAERYPDTIKPIYETENQYSKRDGSLRRIMDEHTRGKYIAYCEGDDYWIDPLKLQTQVDFLEANPDYGMCYAIARRFIQKKNKFSKDLGRDTDFDDLLFNTSKIPTASVVLRKDLYFDYVNEINPDEKKWLFGDIPLWLYMLKKTKVKFMEKVVSVYRILEESACHFTDIDSFIAFRKSDTDMRNTYIRMYTDKEELVFDEHKRRAWLMARHEKYMRKYTRFDVLDEISKALSLEKRDELLMKICKIPFLLFLARLRWKLLRLLRVLSKNNV